MTRLAEQQRNFERVNNTIARTMIGKRIDDAEVTAEFYNLRYRTVKLDGVARTFPEEVRTDRVNFVVDRGRVTSAWIA